jgi:hypothetical protein
LKHEDFNLVFFQFEKHSKFSLGHFLAMFSYTVTWMDHTGGDKDRDGSRNIDLLAIQSLNAAVSLRIFYCIQSPL